MSNNIVGARFLRAKYFSTENYSLSGNGNPNSQDLGLPGSCLQRFNTMPFMFCENTDACNYAARNDRSYWLNTMKPYEMRPFSGTEIEKHISRCVVCEVPNYTFAVHSQSNEIPRCPNGYSRLWQGYSWVMHTGAGARGGGQSLSSTGSCLESFTTVPFIECNGARGTCTHFANKLGFWLAHVDSSAMFQTPTSSTREEKPNDPLSKYVSRCAVCMKNI